MVFDMLSEFYVEIGCFIAVMYRGSFSLSAISEVSCATSALSVATLQGSKTRTLSNFPFPKAAF